MTEAQPNALREALEECERIAAKWLRPPLSGDESLNRGWNNAAKTILEEIRALPRAAALSAPAAPGELREQLAQWMLRHRLATGHGDTIEDLVGELVAQYVSPVGGAPSAREQSLEAALLLIKNGRPPDYLDFKEWALKVVTDALLAGRET